MSEDAATVTRLQGYTFELRVDEELAHEMRRFAGSCRFVFNRALRFEQEIFDLCGFLPGYAELSEEMTRWKEEPETFWLEDAPSQALQQSLQNLEDAWDRHFESPNGDQPGDSALQIACPMVLTVTAYFYSLREDASALKQRKALCESRKNDHHAPAPSAPHLPATGPHS